MNVTNHFLQRYVQRVLKISNDKTEISRYINDNKERITEDCLKMREYAEKIWKGQLGDNITRNYYLRDNWILVSNTDDSALVTIYEVDFGFPTHTNRKIIDDLIEQLHTFEDKLLEVSYGIEDFVQKTNLEIEAIDAEMKTLEDRMVYIRNAKKMKQEEIKLKYTETNAVNNKINEIANKICNSIEYKKDIQEGMK